jgi:hypothetical protein
MKPILAIFYFYLVGAASITIVVFLWQNKNLIKHTQLEKTQVFAQTYEEVPLVNKIDQVKLKKIGTLKAFFTKYKSPLKDHSAKFVEVSDKYALDYRLLPAISCIESTCGKFIISGSYNPFGWGIYNGKVTRFDSFDDAIETVGKGLKKHYIDKGLDTPAKIAPIYTPPRPEHWLKSVNFFMSEIDKHEIKEDIVLNYCPIPSAQQL